MARWPRMRSGPAVRSSPHHAQAAHVRVGARDGDTDHGLVLYRDEYSMQGNDMLELTRGQSSPRGRSVPAEGGWLRRSAHIVKSSGERWGAAVEILA